MATILYVAGGLAFLAGLVATAFGSPASALDFGNTLIEAGVTGAVGGLITIALGAVVGRLQRIVDLLSAPLPHEHEQPASPPPRFESRPAPFEPRGPSAPPEFPPFAAATPPGPPAVETAASPEPPVEEPAPDLHQAEASPAEPASAVAGPAEPAPAEPAPPDLPPKSFFDSVWPDEKKPPSSRAEPAPEPLAEPEKPRAVAVLKSGVVDGMGYTLYVDGSIEAELPQGTVRFASINELREHLENKAS